MNICLKCFLLKVAWQHFTVSSRSKSVEQRVLADVFCFFVLENRENLSHSLRRFPSLSEVFSTHFTSFQSFRVATSSVPGRYVFRVGSLRLTFRGAESLTFGTPRGDPRLTPDSLRPSTPDSTTVRSRLHNPPLLSRRYVRSEKSSGSEKVFENEGFLCSLVLKKSSQERYVFHSHSPFPIPRFSTHKETFEKPFSV